MLDAKLVRGDPLLDCHQRVVVDRAGRERFSVAQCAVAEHRSGVSAAAVAEAGDLPDEDLVRPEGVPVARVGDPLPGRRLHQLAQHKFNVMPSR